jgi:hypothetical protein
MYEKTKQEQVIFDEMLALLADQFYHQQGDIIHIKRMEFADMLTKQTMHGMELGKNSHE